MNQTVKSVHITIHGLDNKITKLNEDTVYGAVKSLHDFHSKPKLLHISIDYKSGIKKKANFDAKVKAISWLNLNDVNDGKE